jgi:hypothetical protein
VTRRSPLFAALIGLTSPLGAQAILSITGTVVGPNGAPLPYSTASIAETGVARFTDEAGEFIMAGLQPGSYHLRVKQLGFSAVDTLITLASGAAQKLRIELKPTPFKLAAVTVKASRECETPEQVANRGNNFALIIDELRNNAERERILVKSYPFVYRHFRSVDRPTPSGASFAVHDTTSYRSDTRPRYVPGEIVRPDPDRPPPNNQQIMIPVLEDIGDPEFLRSHCFKYAGITRENGIRMHRVDFEPVRSIRTPDIEGSFFLDPTSFVVRRATLRLTHANQVDLSLRDVEVTTNYNEILPGVTVIGDLISVQNLSGVGIAAPILRSTEKQRLIDYRFLGTKPGGPPQRE